MSSFPMPELASVMYLSFVLAQSCCEFLFQLSFASCTLCMIFLQPTSMSSCVLHSDSTAATSSMHFRARASVLRTYKETVSKSSTRSLLLAFTVSNKSSKIMTDTRARMVVSLTTCTFEHTWTIWLTIDRVLKVWCGTRCVHGVVDLSCERNRAIIHVLPIIGLELVFSNLW